MTRPIGDAAGERLELPAYYADFQRNFRRAREFWKLERGQVFAEPGDASWEAFDAGDWDEAMRLAEARRADLRRYHEENTAAGIRTRRIRIVSLPVTSYLQWELHLLRLRDEAGGPIRILRAEPEDWPLQTGELAFCTVAPKAETQPAQAIAIHSQQTYSSKAQ